MFVFRVQAFIKAFEEVNMNANADIEVLIVFLQLKL